MAVMLPHGGGDAPKLFGRFGNRKNFSVVLGAKPKSEPFGGG